MFIKDFVKDYLSFSKRDRTGLLALISLILIINLLPRFFSKDAKGLSVRESPILKAAIDTLSLRQAEDPKRREFEKTTTSSKNFPPSRSPELFQFDPNTISAEDWQRLGISEKTSKTIEKYRSKGGKFYKPEDVQKIWGLPPGFYDRVKDYIVLETAPQKQTSQKPFEKPPFKPTIIDINLADTTAFILLPGIGSKLASRIVSFRDKLGGFYSVEQVAETYGLADSVFQKIKPRLQLSDLALRKLNINLATKDELKSHPYFKWQLANAIVEYRNQHGTFKTVDELKGIRLIDEATFKRIFPYVAL